MRSLRIYIGACPQIDGRGEARHQYERRIVGRGLGQRDSRRGMLELCSKACLTPPILLEIAIFRQPSRSSGQAASYNPVSKQVGGCRPVRLNKRWMIAGAV